MNPPDAEATYLLIDGENIDATLGLSVLDRRPTPDERPRWDRIREATEQLWHQQVRGLFYLNGTSGYLPMGFIQALHAMGYRALPLAGPDDMKVVDVGIQRTLEAIAEQVAQLFWLLTTPISCRKFRICLKTDTASGLCVSRSSSPASSTNWKIWALKSLTLNTMRTHSKYSFRAFTSSISTTSTPSIICDI